MKSSNKKTGKIPVTTSTSDTCPDACPLKAGGCYARSGPLKLHWDKVTKGERGESTIEDFCDIIESLPEGQLWRHNQAGDLAGDNDTLDVPALEKLVEANRGKRGYTYTHKPLKKASEKKAIKWSNENGFTINLSGNTPKHADELLKLNIGPVVTILPQTVEGQNPDLKTPNGVRILVCPATYKDEVSCETCKLCSRTERKYVIGFPAHGTSKKKATAIAMA